MNVREQDLEQRAAQHAALGDVARLAIVDLLAASDASPSELRAALGVAAPLLAHHLRVLEQAGLVARRRSDGDGRRSYLHLEPSAAPHGSAAPQRPVSRVLFVCTGNSSRSPLAAGVWAEVSDVRSESGGTRPAKAIAPGALAVAARHGLDLGHHVPRSFRGLVADGDLVVTVCDRAHEAIDDGDALHWSLPNPSRLGTPEAYEDTYAELRSRATALAERLAA
ncbi:ArsR family transcriptional regulator [Curtobacterium sp. VKM Ac-1376]|uniref:arsenate reductase/protein-tyrosine-phosphatase family protein n=1 Tax=Curtobacterium sp. VKM Ac-1376 TaxID=123312 RepID=UPI00188B8747|nr:ArsR family transcriptional regulator [Curtobacterium sp. VKM Ac-1376]MBF4615707.1 ArsR family transcriptional regulator [Curtobacterium sp. VKM Ac-1376]